MSCFPFFFLFPFGPVCYCCFYVKWKSWRRKIYVRTRHYNSCAFFFTSMTFEFEPCYYYLQDLNKVRKFMLGPWVGTGFAIIPASMHNLLKQIYFILFVYTWLHCLLVTVTSMWLFTCFAPKYACPTWVYSQQLVCREEKKENSRSMFLAQSDWIVWNLTLLCLLRFVVKYVKCLSLFALPELIPLLASPVLSG